MKRLLVRGFGAFALASGLLLAPVRPAHAGEVSVTVVNVETPQGVKIWVPETIVAKKGDTVKLKLVNKLANPHGFQISAFGIEKIVGVADSPEGTVEVSFTADKAGVFPIACQLHPTHVTGQLVILE